MVDTKKQNPSYLLQMFLSLCLHVTVQIMRKITEQSTSQTFMAEKSFGTEGEHFSAHAIY
jgi:hypothetical protein